MVPQKHTEMRAHSETLTIPELEQIEGVRAQYARFRSFS
jgi:hypothetical protein